MKFKFILTLIASVATLFSFAQSTGTVTGTVTDVNGKKVVSATVLLLKATDSSLYKTEITNAEGAYTFNQVAVGNYFTKISALSFKEIQTEAFAVSVGVKTTATHTLPLLEKTLTGVVVTTKKPMVQVKADKMVVNVEGTMNAVGNNGIDLLKKSPGIIVDKDDNISMSGKNGVRIYIDGRPSPLTGADLANYLKSIQSTQVEAIELITSPGAKYEAAGNAGIINIKLKKDKSMGTNGSANLGYAIGVNSKYNAGVNFNNRNKKINLFGSLNGNISPYQTSFNLERFLLDTAFINETQMNSENRNLSYKFGVDYFINKKSTFGILVNANTSKNENRNASETPISYMPTNTVTQHLTANNSATGKNNNININTNYKYTSGGKDLNVDLDYGNFSINTDQIQPNTYFNAAKTVVLSRANYQFVSPVKINIGALKIDYEQELKDKSKLGFGTKIAYTDANNHFERYNLTGSTKALDVPRSNEFDYKENINALYANWNKELKGGKQIQLGLRAENTNATGDTYGLFANTTVNTTSKQTFKRNYTDFFPSASITFAKNPMKTWTLAYSRRIDRPDYQDLNPFEFKLDEYTFQKGNTNLIPQYTNNFTITNVYKYMLTTSLSFSQVDNVFTQLVDTAEKSKSFITKKNIARQRIVSLNISRPFQKKWYSGFVNLNTFFSNYKADFGGGNRIINIDVFTAQLYAQNSFTLNKKGLVAELSGFATTPSVWEGTFKSNALWSVDMGLSKPIFKNRATVKIAVSDVFRSLKWRGTADFSGQRTTAFGYGESQQLKVNLNYRFGNNAVKAARQRNSAIDDEKSRTAKKGLGS
jgi:iron complex outermembrane recepter protein